MYNTPMSDTPIIQPRLLKGFRDTLPAQMRARQHLIATTQAVLETFAFTPLETPALEFADILLGKLGDEGEKLLYKFTDHGQREVALRYDFSVPLARVVAQYPDLPKPFKRYQVGPVWRADNTQRGRFREFYQFDMDIVGSTSPLADAEILVLIQNILLKLGLTDFIIRVNDRQYMNDQLISCGLSVDEQKVVYAWLDKWDKIGGEVAVLEGLKSDGLSSEQVSQVKEALLSPAHKSLTTALQHTLNLAASLGLQERYIKIDPSVVRGLDYYSGIVFETNLTNAPEYGSIFSGGRYDGLVGRFSHQQVPAVGASIGVDRLLAAMEALGLSNHDATKKSVFVTLFNQDLASQGLDLAQLLRSRGIDTEVAFDIGSISKQLKVASQKGVTFVAIIGPDEAAQHLVTLRDMQNGNEQKLTQDQLIDHLLQG